VALLALYLASPTTNLLHNLSHHANRNLHPLTGNRSTILQIKLDKNDILYGDMNCTTQETIPQIGFVPHIIDN
jgi:hypothetical protein